MKAFLDTHVALELARDDPATIGPKARDVLERSALFVSPIVRLEIEFLRRIGRTRRTGPEILSWLADWRGVQLSHDDLDDVGKIAESLEWTRDPFDLLIVATATLHTAPLVTRDRRILEHYAEAVW